MKFLLSTTLAFFIASTSFIRAADMDERIHDATRIVDQRQGSDDPIPAEILQNAKGVAICTILKGGIGIGGQGGEGIVLVRHLGDGPPVWRRSFRIQYQRGERRRAAGFSTISYIIVLNTERAIGTVRGPGQSEVGCHGDRNRRR